MTDDTGLQQKDPLSNGKESTKISRTIPSFYEGKNSNKFQPMLQKNKSNLEKLNEENQPKAIKKYIKTKLNSYRESNQNKLLNI